MNLQDKPTIENGRIGKCDEPKKFCDDQQILAFRNFGDLSKGIFYRQAKF